MSPPSRMQAERTAPFSNIVEHHHGGKEISGRLQLTRKCSAQKRQLIDQTQPEEARKHNPAMSLGAASQKYLGTSSNDHHNLLERSDMNLGAVCLVPREQLEKWRSLHRAVPVPA